MAPSSSRSETGREAEQLAEKYLCKRGLRLERRNYRCRGGELDLIMHEGQTLVFVEVRYRKHQRFGGALASVDRHKQQRLLHAARHYLQRTGNDNRPCRIDVVAIAPGRWGRHSVQWVKNAIEAG
ncbi:MAG: YraN family protein [Pseudomonadota bacterium]